MDSNDIFKDHMKSATITYQVESFRSLAVFKVWTYPHLVGSFYQVGIPVLFVQQFSGLFICCDVLTWLMLPVFCFRFNKKKHRTEAQALVSESEGPNDLNRASINMCGM